MKIQDVITYDQYWFAFRSPDLKFIDENADLPEKPRKRFKLSDFELDLIVENVTGIRNTVILGNYISYQIFFLIDGQEEFFDCESAISIANLAEKLSEECMEKILDCAIECFSKGHEIPVDDADKPVYEIASDGSVYFWIQVFDSHDNYCFSRKILLMRLHNINQQGHIEVQIPSEDGNAFKEIASALISDLCDYERNQLQLSKPIVWNSGEIESLLLSKEHFTRIMGYWFYNPQP